MAAVTPASMAQLCAMLAGVPAAMQQMQGEIKNEMNGNARQMENKMDANTQAFINDARALRGERRQMGQCLQVDKMATPRAATNELEGSAPAGEDR